MTAHALDAFYGYVATTPDGTIVDVNETLLAWTGYARDELVGRRTFSDLLTGGGRIYHETHFAPLLRMSGGVREIALDIVCADGTRLPVLVNSLLERDDTGEPRAIRTAVYDATERREYERELLRAKQRAEESETRATVLARTLQQTLIPPTPPDVPGLDVAAVYRPAGDGREVGGDFYDVFQIASGDWVVTVGDVCGKGVDAAVVTAVARYTLRAAAVRVPQPAQALEILNEVLLRHESDRFCTVAMLRLRERADGWSATATSGGHPRPLLLRDGEEPTWFGPEGSLIGVVDTPSLVDTEVVLRPGDCLVLYTDGVPEARRDGEFYGEERLVATVRRCSADATSIAEGLVSDVVGFQRGDARDDIAVVALMVPRRGGGRG